MYPESFAVDYSRLERTPFTRERMRQVRALVVGAGALGNEVARVLGMLGAAQVVVVDPDVVDATNLPRSFFFSGGKSIGQNKAWALAVSAEDLFPDSRWVPIGKEIADVGFQVLARSNLFFSCVDSDLARLEIAYISRRLNVPVVDGGLSTQNFSHGRVTFFSRCRGQACYGCMLTPRKRRELLEMWQATLRPCTPGDANIEAGSTPTMAGIVGSMQVELGLRNFFEAKKENSVASHSYEIQIHPQMRLDTFTVPASVDCPFHEPAGQLSPMPHVSATFADILESTRGEHVILDWPICVEARCMDCGREWAPLVRLAALRRRGRCPECGSAQVLELQTVRTIGHDSPWLRSTPAALQLPADHLYTVQRSNSR